MQLVIGFVTGIVVSIVLLYPGFNETKTQAMTNQINLENCNNELTKAQSIIQGVLISK